MRGLGVVGFRLDKVVPWGRSFEEYVAMFNLTKEDLGRRILGCGDGPAGFNAELTKRGGCVVSVDPIYALDTDQIQQRIAETYDAVLAQMRVNEGDYIWTSIKSVEDLGRVRMSAMNTFLSDYESGRDEGRYIEGGLPSLALSDHSFDIALSSHFLFLYSAHLSAEFHACALKEMLRVALEVRIFPLRALDGAPSPHLDSVIRQLERLGFEAEVLNVHYEFQRGTNEMLCIKKSV